MATVGYFALGGSADMINDIANAGHTAVAA